MDGKCKICKEDALCYSSEDKGEKVYRFFCLNEVCDNHNPCSENTSLNINEIPEWFRWKTFSDKLYDKRFKILFMCCILYLFAFVFYLVCNKKSNF